MQLCWMEEWGIQVNNNDSNQNETGNMGRHLSMNNIFKYKKKSDYLISYDSVIFLLIWLKYRFLMKHTVRSYLDNMWIFIFFEERIQLITSRLKIFISKQDFRVFSWILTWICEIYTYTNRRFFFTKSRDSTDWLIYLTQRTRSSLNMTLNWSASVFSVLYNLIRLIKH